MISKNLDKIMCPKSVAVIGASDKVDSVGYQLIRNIIDCGFTGEIFAVNPTKKSIMELPSYSSVNEIGKSIDLAIIAVKADIVFDILVQCREAGINNIIIISAGFREIGGIGIERENEIVEYAKQHNINILGPNCLGVINLAKGIMFNGCFAPTRPIAGDIGFATQSGALASGIINMLPMLNVGIAQMISLGNQSVVDISDVIEYWEKCEEVKIILLYIESIKLTEEFRKLLQRVNRIKPIIVLKSGRSPKGKQATSSHTGSLAGEEVLVDAFLKSCGVIREFNINALFNTAKYMQIFEGHKYRNSKFAIVTNAGGPGIIATDMANDLRIPLVDISDGLKEKLRNILPPQASVRNPIDTVATATFEQYSSAIECILASGEVDTLLVIYLYIAGRNDRKIADFLNLMRIKYPFVILSSIYMTTSDFFLEVEKSDNLVPIHKFIDVAMNGISRVMQRGDTLNTVVGAVKNENAVPKDISKSIIKKYGKNETLTTLDSMIVFKEYGLPIPEFAGVHTKEEAIEFARKTGYPVVLKISSRTVTHKTDIGGVVTNIEDEKQLDEEWDNLIARMRAKNILNEIEYIVVMRQIGGSREFVIGGIANEGSMPFVSLGMGGIYVEQIGNIAFRPVPLKQKDIEEMIHETIVPKMIGNIRNKKAGDIEVLKRSIVSVGDIFTDNHQVAEIDANPMILDDEGQFYIVDARIVCK